VTGDLTAIKQGATSLATYGYDNLGRRTSLTFANGAVQAFGYDPVSRLASLTNDLTSTPNDLSATFAYNPASQLTSTVRTGDAYAWTGHFNTNVTGTANGLNQLTSVGPKSLSHDNKGNVIAFGTKSFTYSSENLLLTGPNSTTLSYDPLARLYQTSSGATTSRFAYDGVNMIAEYNGSNTLQRRWVFDPASGQPLVWYEGTGTAATDRRYLSSDERGSIVSVSSSAGASLGLNSYDEFGNPGAANLGMFGYTGQAWLPSMGVWYYRARIYEPELGRFLQTDPAGGANLYNYVSSDPIGRTDPSGMIDRFGLSGDDMSRFVDFTPQGTGWGTHSYDWMGYIGTPVSGRIEEMGIARDIARFREQYGSSAPLPEEYWACVRFCNTSAGGPDNDHIVVQPSPVYAWVQLPSIRFDRIQLAQIGGRSNNCKAAAYVCLESSPSGPYYHKQCMDFERTCYMASRRANDNDKGGKTEAIEICSHYVCVTIWEGGIVSVPYPNPLAPRTPWKR